MAYNDCFRRDPEKVAFPPSDGQKELYNKTIEELLDGIDQSEDYELFHAELLRETGRFDESRQILLKHKSDEDKWVVDAMLNHIEKNDAEPFLLIENGNVVL